MADSRAEAAREAYSQEEGGGVADVAEPPLFLRHPASPGPARRWLLWSSVQPWPWMALILLSSSAVADLTPCSSRTLRCHFDKSYTLLTNWLPGREKCLIEASSITCYPRGGKQTNNHRFWSQTPLCELQLHFLLVLRPGAISLNFLCPRVLIYEIGIVSL